MYFPALPLLLLFASAICASPIHIGRRADNQVQAPAINVQSLPLRYRQNGVDDLYALNFGRYGEPIKGVEGASKCELPSGDIMVRVEVEASAVGPVNMIDKDLRHDLHFLRWENIPGTHRVVVIMKMAAAGEAIVIKYLGKPEINAGSTPHDTGEHSNSKGPVAASKPS